jgi:hypothetical protein
MPRRHFRRRRHYAEYFFQLIASWLTAGRQLADAAAFITPPLLKISHISLIS